MKILCIDDDNLIRKVMTMRLSALGFSVYGASDGLEGIEILDNDSEIEFVILDMEMPVLNGFQFLHLLGSRCFAKDIQVFIHSGMPLREVVDKMTTLNVPQQRVAGFMPKLPSLDELRSYFTSTQPSYQFPDRCFSMVS